MGFNLRSALIKGVAVLSISALVACGDAEVTKVEGNNDGGNSSQESEAAKEAPAEQQLKVGETVDFDGLKVTLNEARIEKGGDFDEPQEEQFLVVNLTAENTKDEEATVSSIMNIELMDADAYSYTTTILTEGVKGQFDGTIAAGGKLRGEIPFDVPKSDSYELHYSNPFKSGKAIWVIPASELGGAE